MTRLTFLGAAGTVTGSKYLLERGDLRLLVDCGLYQGLKPLRLQNWEHAPIDPRTLDAVLLTHAHIDHSGFLPRLVNEGFRGKVWCTSATLELCRLLLPDSGHLQEEDAEYANRHGFSKHHPALPLYTQEDAERALTHKLSAPVGSAKVAVFIGEPLRQPIFSNGPMAFATQQNLIAATAAYQRGDMGRL